MQTLKQKLVGTEQISESLLLNLLLACSGGFQDAYTYIGRCHVFANAQTGNIVLLSTHLLSGNVSLVLHYLLPVLAFAGGIFFADFLRLFHQGRITSHWRQTVLLWEIIILFIVGLIPSSMNDIANMLVSFSCAMQVESFRKVNGRAYASTMCIGNLRSCMAALSECVLHGNKEKWEAVTDYLIVITVFALGAGFGGVLAEQYGLMTIWVSPLVLVIVYAMMYHKPIGEN